MIITTEKHGRNAADREYLIAHLMNLEDNAFVLVAEIGNSAAADLAGVVKDMEILRDGSEATCAFHHITVDPAHDHTNETVIYAANQVRLTLDPSNERPYCVLLHKKACAGSDNKGSIHAHVVIGNVNSEGRALKDGRSKIRTEAAAKILEHELKEPCTPTRHYDAILKILQKTAPLTADWFVASLGTSPEKPRSAMSSATRARAKRAGIDLPKAKAGVAAAWSKTQEIAAFRSALTALGYSLAAGKKENVWVVIDKAGNLIGAADRLLRMRRDEFSQLMETPNELNGAKAQRGLSAANGRSRQETVRTIKNNQRTTRPTESPVDVAGKLERGGGRSRPDITHTEVPRIFGGQLAAPNSDASYDRGKARYSARQREYRRALRSLREIGRLIKMSVVCSRTQHSGENLEGHLATWVGHVDLWGVPIEPSKYRP